MAQHDYVIDNASGATVRADINSALSAIQTLNSGTSAPSSTAAGMLWLDTTGGAPYALKIRDAGNNHWLTLGNVTDPGADGNLELLPGKINLPSSGGVYESDGSTEILTELSGAVTLKNTAIDSTVTMSANQSAVKTALNATGSAGIYACRAWARIGDNNGVILSASGGVSGISVTGNGTQAEYSITLSIAIDADERCIVTNGYTHEGGVIEGTVELATGNYNPTDSIIKIIYQGNNSSHFPDFIGLAVFH